MAYQASQHTVEYWRSTWSEQQPNITWHTAAAAAVGSTNSLQQQQQQQQQRKHKQPPVRTWRVLFQTRTEEVRQLTNLQQLLDRCAAWQYTDAATGAVHHAQCGVWPATPMPDVIAGGLLACASGSNRHWFGVHANCSWACARTCCIAAMSNTDQALLA